MKEYNNNYKDIFLFILEKTFNIIDYHTSYCTAQYFHNIYSMLILLNDNRKKINIESYLRTLRAEFNQEELLFIYYYACIRNANNIKFKSLVEDTCLFHNLNNERLDHDPLHDKPFVLYGKSAFTH
ncbi:putative phage abortive infection protein [Mailhella massiliensis]|uniref:putative phage abortive infection protein n=1 Tax=Mailhella massiliensis TaxID=1903261 RepID=UPI00097D21DE